MPSRTAKHVFSSKRWQRHESVRAFLEDYSVTKRQLALSPR